MIGIYKIENLINHKVYIGKSYHIERRWKDEKQGNCNSHIKASIEKYGIENFSFTVLREIHDSGVAHALLNSLEEHYIRIYKSYDREFGYNKTHGGEGQKCNEETRQKMSEAKKGEKCAMYGKSPSAETRKKIGDKHRGKKVSKETRLKISRALKGKPSHPMSPEAREKLRKANLGLKHSPERIEKNRQARLGKPLSETHRKRLSEVSKGKHMGKDNAHSKSVICVETGKVYDSIMDAERDTGIANGSISAVCKNKPRYKTAGGYHWRYYEEHNDNT